MRRTRKHHTQLILCSVRTTNAAAWTLPVVSSTTQLALRSDDAVDGGVGPLCGGPDEKPKGFDEACQRAHKMSRDFSVHHARVHGVCAHTENCGQQQALVSNTGGLRKN